MNLPPEFFGHDKEMILRLAARLKETDGEGWAVGEFVERVIKEATSTKPKSTQAFDSVCSISLNHNLDVYQLKYAGEVVYLSKSKFKCRLEKQRIKEELEV